MEYLETELDKINRYYRSKLINVITIPPIYNISPEQIPHYFSGIFMEATETGVWIMIASGSRQGKVDFYFHDKIIKIEEAGPVDLDELESEQRNKIKKSIKSYEEKRKNEIEEFNKEFTTPDIKDPDDKEGIANMLNKVQKMVLENREKEENNPGDFLEKRAKP